MKTIYRFIIATFAAAVALALASCSKEMIKPDAESESGCENDSVRVITVSYVATKAYFHPNELTPQFSVDDVIKVSNGSKIEDCTVTRKNSVYQISTKLPGRLTAVFPASAAIISGTEITGVDTTVKDNQGKGRDVMNHISAIATIEPTATSATFEIQQAVFFFDIWYGCQFLNIISLNTIGSDGFRSGEKVPIATTESGAPAYSITIIGGAIANNTCAVIQPGVKLSDLSFDIISYSNGNRMKGIPLSVIGTRQDQTVANGYYTIDDQNWHDYVEIGGVKWAKQNIGATAETGTDSYGEYFMWGDIQGYRPSSSVFTFPADNPSPDSRFPGGTWDAAQGFSDYNEPFYLKNNSRYEKYKTTNSILEIGDDPAYLNWGGAWRLPTGDEIAALASSSGKEWDDGYKCYKFTSGGFILYFPAAGHGQGTTLQLSDSNGYYWSSNTDKSLYYTKAECLFLNSSKISKSTMNRNSGLNVRPVATVPVPTPRSDFNNLNDGGSY